MTYRIIRVDGEDEEYAELLKELHDEIFSNTAPQIDPEGGWWWVATDGREFAGICGFTPTYTDPTIGYLKRAGVRLPHRGKGLQRRFVRVREMLARKLCLHCLVTHTSDNPSSANNLIACGYRIYRPDEPWGFPHTIYWFKDL